MGIKARPTLMQFWSRLESTAAPPDLYTVTRWPSLFSTTVHEAGHGDGLAVVSDRRRAFVVRRMRWWCRGSSVWPGRDRTVGQLLVG